MFLTVNLAIIPLPNLNLKMRKPEEFPFRPGELLSERAPVFFTPFHYRAVQSRLKCVWSRQRPQIAPRGGIPVGVPFKTIRCEK